MWIKMALKLWDIGNLPFLPYRQGGSDDLLGLWLSLDCIYTGPEPAKT